MPGVPKELRGAEIDESRIGRINGMIHSMTPAERANPDIIDASRRQRIALGSGCRPAEVKALIDQFKQMRNLMRGLGGAGSKRVAKRAQKAARSRSAKSSRTGGGSPRGASGRRRGGGRTTPKGPAKVNKAPLRLPGLEEGGFGSLSDLSQRN